MFDAPQTRDGAFIITRWRRRQISANVDSFFVGRALLHALSQLTWRHASKFAMMSFAHGEIDVKM